MSIRASSFSILLGAALIAFVCSLLLVCSAFFVLGLPISPLQVPIATLATAAFTWWTVGVYFPAERRQMFGRVIGITAVALIVLVIVGGLLYDVSWDGQTYHADAIVQLANGWNPFRTPTPPGAIFPTYMSFFAKGPWIYAAALYKFTGNYEQGKAFHLILI